MLNPIKPDISLADDLLNKDRTENYKLSIRLSPDGFSFCTLDEHKNKYLSLESYSIKPPRSNEEYIGLLNDIIESANFLKQRFKSVHLLYENNHFTLIPDSLFNPEKKELYLHFNHEIDPSDKIAYNKLINLDAFNIYTMPASVNQWIKQTFPDAIVTHSISVLVEGILLNFKNANLEKTVFIQVRPTSFDVLYVKNNKVVFLNSFNYRTNEDFVYFLMYVLEQLQLNPEYITLQLIGGISEQSALYILISKYVKYCRFIDRNDSFLYSRVFDQLPSHTFYNLLNLNQCEL